MKKRKGQILRPCVHCHKQVRYVLWEGKLGSHGQAIYHWQNEDGSHHVCDLKGKSADRQIVQKAIAMPEKSEGITTYPNHDYPLWSRTDIAPWDESLGEFSYT